jgi:CheY-like chemotaxis protein/anti-sigma regulatory factor (Ser/Thr protein kinase)
VVLEAVEMIKPIAIARHITVRMAECRADVPRAMVDRHRLRQILLNLCSNGVKYNRPGGSVVISCGAHAGGVRIAVQDEGIGIPEEKLPLLFTPFERLGAEQTTVEGTGLGLALCKRLAEAMGGSLSVASRVGRGSTFNLDLQATSANAPAARPMIPAATPPAIEATAGLVLYIEDTAANARLMHRLMARRPGVQLLIAPDGTTGLRLFAEHRPRLVMLDLHLPDMTGEEILRRIRDTRDDSHTHIAVLTADASTTQQQRLLALGADAYLTKPLSVPVVLALLDQALTEAAVR